MSHNDGYDHMVVIDGAATDYWRLDTDDDACVNKAHVYAVSSSSTPMASATDLLPAANNNGSLAFDGSTSYVTMTYPQLTNGQTTGAGSFSIECWIRPAADQSASDVIGIAQRAGCFGLYLAYGCPTFFTQLSGQARVTASDSSAVSTSTNYHLVGTYHYSEAISGGTHGVLRLYVNGSLVATTTTAAGTAVDQGQSINFTVGSWDTSTLFFNGNITNVAIYDGEVLNATTISNHYNYAG